MSQQQQQRTATIKVGLLTIVALFVLITAIIWLRGRSLGGGQPYDVYFKDVDGLREGAPVQFMGLRVGFVDSVEPTVLKEHQYRVHIRFTITDDDLLHKRGGVPKGSYISLEQSGLIGEKFVEITPPRPKNYNLVLSHLEPRITEGLPIRVYFREGWRPVGNVMNRRVSLIKKVTTTKPDYKYELKYLINQPGYLPPEKSVLRFATDANGLAFLELADPEAAWSHEPEKRAYFTLQEPLRLKDFLQEQLASAESLKLTNDKINQLLSDETISSLQSTAKNAERLTAETTSVMRQARSVLAETSSDLHSLVASANNLTGSVTEATNNINAIAKDPEMKGSIKDAVRSIQQASTSLNEVLSDPNLKATLAETHETSKSAAELVAYLKQTTIDGNLQGKLNESLTLLNSSLTKLNTVLGDVQTTTSDRASIQAILQDTKSTSENLNKFSERLNKRFLLFRLLF